MKSPRTHHQLSLRVLAWILFGATVATVLWARIHLARLPLERDEGEYAYTGQLLLSGIPPYKFAYSMKFPGTAAAYAVFMAVFGESIVGIHFGLILVNLATIALIFFLGREFLGELGGAASAASYSILSLMPYVLGNAAHATHFVTFFAVAGALLLLRSSDRQSPLLVFATGCLFGLAVLMKQPGLFFVAFGSFYLFTRDWHARLGLKQIFSRNLLLIGGAATPCLATVFLLWQAGVLEKFWFWTINYATQYGSSVSLTEGLRILAVHFLGVVGKAWPVWVLALIGIIGFVFNRTIRNRALFLIPFAFFSALSVCSGLYFRPHYFIPFLPVVSLLSGAALVGAFSAFRTEAQNLRLAILMVFAACLAWPLWSERDFFFERPLPEANRMVNGTNPFPESIRIAEFIRNRSSPADTIAVLGSEPQIYFYAQRHSATGYIYTYSLMEPQPYAHQMQQEMIGEIEAARPKFLILIVIGKSWLAGRDSDQTILRWIANYCDANYDEVGLINISNEGSEYFFPSKPQNVTPTGEHILVYQRKA